MSNVVTWINPIINKACVSYGFLHLIENWLQSVVLLLFVNNSILTLTLLCYTAGPQLTYLYLKNRYKGYTVLFGHLVSF